MTQRQLLAAGTVLGGDFRIEELAAETEYAAAYRGVRLSAEVPVLIRVFDVGRHLPPASLPMVRRRFVNEATRFAEIFHPNLESVLAAAEEASDIVLVTESMGRARPIPEILAAGPLAVPEALRAGIQALEGLAEAHRHGHPHRDLTPSRLWLGADGTVKVADFALVKLLHTLRGTHEGASLAHPYMAPEQVRGEDVGPKADIYAMGAIVFHLVTGKPPFSSTDDALRRAILEEPPPLDGAGLLAPLADVLSRALRKSPEERFPDAETMADALRRAAAAPVSASVTATTSAPAAVEDARSAAEPVKDAWSELEAALPARPAAPPELARPQPSARSAPSETFDALPKPVELAKKRQASPALTLLVTLALAGTIALFAWMLLVKRPTRPAGSSPVDVSPPPVADTPAPAATPESGLVHDLSTPEPPPPPDENPLQGIDVKKLTPEQKEALLQKLASAVHAQLDAKNAEGARRAMELLTRAAPDDARFYELEAKVLQLAIERPPVPEEGQEVPLVTVDEAPILERHAPPRFPKRPPEEHREVVVKALVDEQGQVADTLVVEDDEFGSGAIAAEAVKTWQFAPAIAKEVRVKVWISIPIRTGGEWKKPEIALVQP